MNDADKVYVVSDGSVDNKIDGIGPNEIGLLRLRENNACRVFFISKWKEISIDCKKISTLDTSKVGDAHSKKICNVCHRLLDTNQFDRNQNGVNNRIIRRPSCKTCRFGMDGNNISSLDRREWLKVKPKNEPFECPICRKRTIAGLTSKVVLEHDHKTGLVRGWVCDSCNTGIGRFKDDPSILARAIKFIKEG